MNFTVVAFIVVACFTLCMGFPTKEIRKRKLARSLKVRPSLDIINGTKVNIADYPYTVSLRLLGYQWGSGIIINNSWVLTSADCVANTAAEAFYVRAGSDSWSLGGQDIQAKDIIVHENYTEFGADYNIALVKVSRKIRFGKKVKSATLGSKTPGDGTRMTIVGWGQSDPSSKVYPASEYLLAANLTTMNIKKCESALKTELKTVFCTPADDHKPEEFDTGDPMIVDGVVYGLFNTAFYDQPDVPPVFTDITQFLPWIQSHIN